MIKKIKLKQLYFISLSIIACFFILMQIIIFRYFIVPQFVKNDINAQIEKINNLFIKHTNYISNILEYIGSLIINKHEINNDFLDNLRFQSNTFSRYKSIWNAILIIDEENLQIENMAIYNASIAQLLENNEIDQVFNLKKIINHCYLCFLNEITINNIVYLPIVYKINTGKIKKIIILIIDPYTIENKLKQHSINNNYINLSFSYLNNIRKINNIFYANKTNDFKKINLYNKECIKNYKLYKNFLYEYIIPGTIESLIISIDINYFSLIKTHFLNTIYCMIICSILILLTFIIINDIIATIIYRNIALSKKNIIKKEINGNDDENLNIILIEDIDFLVQKINELNKDIYFLKHKNFKINKEKEIYIKKQRHMSVALANSLQYRAIYNNSLMKNIMENKFHIDYFEYKQKIINQNIKKNDQLIEFIAIASHEIKTPLYSIIGFVELITQHNSSNIEKKIIDYMMYINECSNYILLLINELIDIAKISDGSFTINKKILQPQKILTQCIRYVSQQASEKNIDINCEISDMIPNILFDPHRLKQIIINILINSINYSPQNTKIYVEMKKINNDMNITIEDNGYGIDSNDIASITNKYWSNNGKYKNGFGLGLFLVKKLVKSHQGKMAIESQINQGTKIVLTFSDHFIIK